MRLFLLLFFAFSLTASAQTIDWEKQLAGLLERFPEADLDGDGTLSVAEAEAFGRKMMAPPKPDRGDRPAPDFPNISYGPHERNTFDLWLPENHEEGLPVPVLVYFHGGGFVSGDKASFDPSPYLKEGIACVSANYRYVNGGNVLSAAPFADSRLLLQTVRARAEEWHLDGGRVAVSGRSAGGVIALMLAYGDEASFPESGDPILSQSTRVSCAIPINTPTNLLPDWIIENIGGSNIIHGSFAMLFGRTMEEALTPAIIDTIETISPYGHVSDDDPPTLSLYTGEMTDLPLPASASPGIVVHHPYFGKALKEKLDGAGIENELVIGSGSRDSEKIVGFLKNHFAMID